jgi:hypothetical protein
MLGTVKYFTLKSPVTIFQPTRFVIVSRPSEKYAVMRREV